MSTSPRIDGSAKVWTYDYKATHGTLVLLPGQTDAAIGVRVIGDTQLEMNETFSVQLSSPTGAVLGHRARLSPSSTTSFPESAPVTVASYIKANTT